MLKKNQLKQKFTSRNQVKYIINIPSQEARYILKMKYMKRQSFSEGFAGQLLDRFV